MPNIRYNIMPNIRYNNFIIMVKQEYEALKKIGKRVMVHAYKFNGWLYRSWDFPMILENNDDYVVLSNVDTSILTSEYNSNRVFGSSTKHPSFWVFWKDEWFNMLITVIDQKPQYYINVSSKFIYEESAVKYIDFDLDFKILPNGSWVELDKNEYNEAKELFNYPRALTSIISDVEEKIEKLIKEGYFSNNFSIDVINSYVDKYEMLLAREKRNNREE